VTTAIVLSGIFIPRWYGPLDFGGRFWTWSLNEIAETRPTWRSEFWKDKKRAVVRVCREGPGTTGYIRSGPKVSIISSTISSYLVVRESSPRPRRRAHSKKKLVTLQNERVDRKVVFVIGDFLETARESL